MAEPPEGPGVPLRTASGRVVAAPGGGGDSGTASLEDGSLRMEALEIEKRVSAGSLTSVRLADVVAAGSIQSIHESMQDSLRYGGVLTKSPSGTAHALPVSTWQRSAMNLCGEILGAGVLSLPSTVAQLGYIVGTALLLVFSMMVMYIGFYLRRGEWSSTRTLRRAAATDTRRSQVPVSHQGRLLRDRDGRPPRHPLSAGHEVTDLFQLVHVDGLLPGEYPRPDPRRRPGVLGAVEPTGTD